MATGQSRHTRDDGEKTPFPFAVRWQNFRGFDDTGWLNIRPLTVLIGPNNSGKTAFHSPLLLMAQTLKARDPAVALLPIGDLTNAGSYRELVRNHDLDLQVTLGLRWRSNKPRQNLKPLGAYAPGGFEATFRPDLEDEFAIRLAKYEVSDSYGRLFFRRKRLRSGRYSLLNLPPRFPWSKSRGRETKLDAMLMKAIRDDLPDHFLFTPNVVIKEALGRAQARKGSSSDLAIPEAAGVYFSASGVANENARRLLRGVSYVGPLRQHPERVYQLSGEAPPDVGLRGEFAPEILYRTKDPDLVGAVDDWLRRLDLAHSIRCARNGPKAFSLALKRSAKGPSVNLADTGFGISQLLPFIVEASYGRDHILTIVEQPEIHLNPRLQSRLAELFVQVVKAGRGVLVETHSEHLIMGIRKLVADGEIDTSDVALYFVESASGASQVTRVPIQSDGHIDAKDWPIGFFEDSLDEAVALAAAQVAGR